MLDLMKEIRLKGREKAREKEGRRPERWACNQCGKSYAPNQRARINAHIANHAIN